MLGVLLVMLVLLVLSSLWAARPKHHGELHAGIYEAMVLAPPERAVTLARTTSGAVLLVTALDAEGVTAIDVGQALQRNFSDPLQVYAVLGAVGLRGLPRSVDTARHRWEELGSPLVDRARHIAAGTNYRGHAEEVGHEGDPFLFPKFSSPTPWNSRVAPGGRLDYEVELCAVLLKDRTTETDTALGYVLCGDYTDRWLLVRDMDFDGEMGRTGFALAKSGEGRLPVGPLLVIPHDDGFYRELKLSLYVNGQLRQSAGAGQMIWSPRAILSRATTDCHEAYDMNSETVHLWDCESIPAGTLLLTGTPEGVLFHPVTLWNPAAYLREGDVVTSFGTYLGFMRNVIGHD